MLVLVAIAVTLFTAGGVSLLIGWPVGAALLWRNTARAPAGCCTRCGYAMRGLGDGASCPECGTQRAADAHRVLRVATGSSIPIGLCALVIAVGVIVGIERSFTHNSPLPAAIAGGVATACGLWFLWRVRRRMSAKERADLTTGCISCYAIVSVIAIIVSLVAFEAVTPLRVVLAAGFAHIVVFSIVGWVLLLEGLRLGRARASERRAAERKAEG